MHVPVGYNKFTCECNPPASWRLGVPGMGRISGLEIHFGRDVRSDEVGTPDQVGVRLGVPCVGRQTLVLLGDASL